MDTLENQTKKHSLKNFSNLVMTTYTYALDRYGLENEEILEQS